MRVCKLAYNPLTASPCRVHKVVPTDADEKKAFAWYERAADLDHPGGLHELGEARVPWSRRERALEEGHVGGWRQASPTMEKHAHP